MGQPGYLAETLARRRMERPRRSASRRRRGRPEMEQGAGHEPGRGRVPLPGGAAQGTKQIGYLTLVACPASGSCLTVGSYTAGGGGTQGLIETAVASR